MIYKTYKYIHNLVFKVLKIRVQYHIEEKCVNDLFYSTTQNNSKSLYYERIADLLLLLTYRLHPVPSSAHKIHCIME